MQLSRVSNYALRLSFQHNVAGVKNQSEKVVGKSALLMAAMGITLSTFSVKQMLSTTRRRF